ncbi:DMT family transporter [Stackebrandtia albiflava]|uniref:DMT family transporter n=1 Tax=Stackebrandtia albiflava TaxID=406432 RepID=UPI001FCE2F89|nr:DMT family transporter [Stackebrandtia albiflava]
MTWQVVAAVVGAWAIAIGAAAQEQPATAASGHAVGRLGLVTQLLRSPRWLWGGAITVAGMILHLAALTNAPLTVIQPLGISGLLVAVWVSARWRARRLTRLEIAGAIAVTAGLTGLVGALPHDTSTAPRIGDTELLWLSAVIVPLSLVTTLSAARMSPRWRAGILAAVAGTCFGVTAALVRVVAHRLPEDPAQLWHWRTAVAVYLLCVGGLLLQNAYRAGHFGMSYSLLLISDPVVAAAVGVVFLGEALPGTVPGAVVATVSAVVTAAGVAVLARRARAPGDRPLDPTHVPTDPSVKEYHDVRPDVPSAGPARPVVPGAADRRTPNPHRHRHLPAGRQRRGLLHAPARHRTGGTWQ